MQSALLPTGMERGPLSHVLSSLCPPPTPPKQPPLAVFPLHACEDDVCELAHPLT